MKTKSNKKIPTYSEKGEENGYLIPIYNINENFHEIGNEPKQVYLTVIKAGMRKGPHLHYIRTGFFTCIKGNIKLTVKIDENYKEFYSGEDHEYLSIIVPNGIPAVIENIGKIDALVVNMPSPAWTPVMNDEHTSDFSDYYNNSNSINDEN